VTSEEAKASTATVCPTEVFTSVSVENHASIKNDFKIKYLCAFVCMFRRYRTPIIILFLST
jgi:hypothetical protein